MLLSWQRLYNYSIICFLYIQLFLFYNGLNGCVAAQVDRLGKFKMQIFGFKHIGALFDEVVTMETLNIVFF